MLKICIVCAMCVFLCASCTRTEQPAAAPVANVDASLPLIGHVDVPQEEATIKGTIDVGGWALWGKRIEAIHILVDGSRIATAALGGSRPDVAKAHPQYSNPTAGWGTIIPAGRVTPGKHRITVQIVGPAEATQELRSFDITVAP